MYRYQLAALCFLDLVQCTVSPGADTRVSTRILSQSVEEVLTCHHYTHLERRAGFIMRLVPVFWTMPSSSFVGRDAHIRDIFRCWIICVDLHKCVQF